MGQRISRAKKTLAEARAEFELPTGPERTERLDDVMAVIYLIFNEGYTATAGDDWMRPDLAHEAMRLARMLAALAPDEPEVLGLQALLEIQGSRMPARLDADSGDRCCWRPRTATRWDQLLIRRGLAALRAGRAARRARDAGRDVLPAGLDRRAARPRRAGRGHRLASDRRAVRRARQAAPGPVVEVNRAVAHGRAFGPDAGLAVLDAVDADALGDSPLVPSVRGDLLERAHQHALASEAFARAAALTRNESERELLRRRAEANLARAERAGVERGGTED